LAVVFSSYLKLGLKFYVHNSIGLFSDTELVYITELVFDKTLLIEQLKMRICLMIVESEKENSNAVWWRGTENRLLKSL